MALRLVTSVTGGVSGNTTLTIPDDNVLPGDLAVLLNWKDASAGSGIPTEQIPTGWTKITGTTLAGDTYDLRTAHSYKILDHDDIGSSITVMATSGFATAARLLIFRADDGLVTGVNVGSINSEATTGDPSQQTINVSGVSAPVISLAHYLTDANVSTNASFSPTEDSEISGFGRSLSRIRIDNSSPSNTTVDNSDQGDNILESLYIQPTVAAPPLWVAEMVTNGGQTSITIPSNAKAGDLAIFIDAYRDDTSPSINAPSGWNLEINDAGGQNIITRRTYARILQAGDPGTSINGLSGAGNEQKAILVLRGNAAITAYSFNDVANTEGLGSVSDQTVNASGGSTPLAVIAEYFGDGTFDWGDDATMTPAPDGRIRPEAITSFLRAAWKIYNSNPQDHTVGLTDPGTNDAVALRSYYVEVTGPSATEVSGSLSPGAPSIGFGPPVGGSLEFDATGDRVDTTLAVPSGGVFTIEAVARSNDFASGRHAIWGSDSSGILLAVEGNGNVNFWPDINIGNASWISAWPGDDEYVHVALTFHDANDTAELFINGVSQGQKTGFTSALASTPGNFQFATWNDGNDLWDGLLSEIRVWDVIRTAEEIAGNRSKRLVGNETNLVGYWPLDDGTGTTADDKTSGNNDGTLIGDPQWGDFAQVIAVSQTRSASGALTTGNASVSGSVDVEASVSGSLAPAAPSLAGSAKTIAKTVSAALVAGAVAFSGDASAQPAATGSLAAGNAQVAAAATVDIAASGDITSDAAQLSATMTTQNTASSSLAPGAVTFAGSVSVENPASAALVSGQAVLDGQAVAKVPVSGALAAGNAQVDAAAVADVEATASLVAGNAQVAGQAAVEVQATGGLVSGAAQLSGQAGVQAQASGSLAAAQPTLAGQAAVEGQVSGALAAGDAQLVGEVIAGGGARGDLLAEAAQVTAQAAVEVRATGTLAPSAAQLSGQAAAQSQASGAIVSGQSALSGQVSVQAQVSPSLAAGNAQLAGAAAGEIQAIGSLAVGNAQLAAAATVGVTAQAALATGPAQVLGEADVRVASQGALQAGNAVLAGQAVSVGGIQATLVGGNAQLAGQVSVAVSASAELSPEPASVSGAAQLEDNRVTGALVAQDAAIAGQVDVLTSLLALDETIVEVSLIENEVELSEWQVNTVVADEAELSQGGRTTVILRESRDIDISLSMNAKVEVLSSDEVIDLVLSV